MSAPVLVLTTVQALNRQVRDVKGLVAGHAVASGSSGEFDNAEVVDGIERRTDYEQAFAHARNAALAGMLDDARRLGANAIVDARLEFREVAPDEEPSICVSFTGTAIVI